MSSPFPSPIIRPVILCGGSGTRLWPVSRQSYPKQFCRLTGPESLFQQAARRFSGAGFAPPAVVTGEAFRFIAAEQLAEAGIKSAVLLAEPEARNTAPAALAAVLWIARQEPGALVLVTPSDHHIPDPHAFRAAVRQAGGVAQDGGLVVFGISPSRAETGYGYLELEAGTDGEAALPRPLRRFIEKPDPAAASVMASSGRHLWNAGMLLARADVIIASYRAHAPRMLEQVEAAMAGAREGAGIIRISPVCWAGVKSISIDYAILEKASNLWTMPYGGAWSDLGGWDAVWLEDAGGPQRLALHGSVTAVDCADSLLHAEEGAMQLVAIGVRDLIAVATSDAVLVADAGRAQEVRHAVEALKRSGARQAEAFRRELRPWGHFDILVSGAGFQVKRIVVRPGAALSLQSHRYRSEHWVVVEGEATVTLSGGEHRLGASQSIDIAPGARHRLANRCAAPLTVIEVQTGSYLGEDDIVRYDDAYARA